MILPLRAALPRTFLHPAASKAPLGLLEKEIKLAIPLRRGPRIAPDVALALRLREENKPWKEIYAAVVSSSLELRTRRAVCAQLRHKVKLHVRRRKFRVEKQMASRNDASNQKTHTHSRSCQGNRRYEN